jgi:hypothetical protein
MGLIGHNLCISSMTMRESSSRLSFSIYLAISCVVWSDFLCNMTALEGVTDTYVKNSSSADISSASKSSSADVTNHIRISNLLVISCHLVVSADYGQN